MNYTTEQVYTFALEAGYDKEAATILTQALALPIEQEGQGGAIIRIILAVLLAQNKEACIAAFKFFAFLKDINPPSDQGSV